MIIVMQRQITLVVIIIITKWSATFNVIYCQHLLRFYEILFVQVTHVKCSASTKGKNNYIKKNAKHEIPITYVNDR